MTETAEHFAPEGATESEGRDDGRDAASSGPWQADDPTAVYRAVTGTFQKRGGELNEEKRRLLLRLLARITPEVEHSARSELAQALARDPAADPDLIGLLVDDRIDIARRIIERSPVLTEADLQRIVATKPREYHQAVAARPALPRAVSTELAESGDPEVIRTLLANGSAQISRRAFASISSAARRHAELRTMLRAREDLPADLARELFTDWAQDEESTAAALAAKLHRAGHLRVSVLVGALRQRQTALFEHAFARLTGLPATELRRLLRDRSGYPLALAARAARMDRSAFSTVFVNYCEARGISPQLSEADFGRAMDVFRNLPQEGARAELHRLAGQPKQAASRRFTSDTAAPARPQRFL